MNSNTTHQQTTPSSHEVMGFSGSPRRGGNSDTLLQSIAAGGSSEEVHAQCINLSKLRFQGCIGCERCRKDHMCTGLKDDLTPLYEKLISARGLILVCPAHNYNITSWMKAFIDRLYCFYNFGSDRPRSWSSQFANQNRVAVLAAICEQESSEDMGFTLKAMRMPLEAMGYRIVGELPVLNVFDRAKVKENKEVMDRAYRLGQALAQSMKNEGLGNF